MSFTMKRFALFADLVVLFSIQIQSIIIIYDLVPFRSLLVYSVSVS